VFYLIIIDGIFVLPTIVDNLKKYLVFIYTIREENKITKQIVKILVSNSSATLACWELVFYFSALFDCVLQIALWLIFCSLPTPTSSCMSLLNILRSQPPKVNLKGEVALKYLYTQQFGNLSNVRFQTHFNTHPYAKRGPGSNAHIAVLNPTLIPC
jgi:hypothetical protein